MESLSEKPRIAYTLRDILGSGSTLGRERGIWARALYAHFAASRLLISFSAALSSWTGQEAQAKEVNG